MESLLKQDFASWFKREGKLHSKCLERKITGEAAVSQALQASLLKWDYGSSPFFGGGQRTFKILLVRE